MGDLDGRTFLVTGANTGIGRASTEALAARGATVYMACRDEARARPAREAIATATGNDSLHLLTVDLADLASVRACAQAFLDTGAPLHGLVNNAGLAGKHGMTASGFEVAFGTNHVGPFLLTSLLLDRLRQSAPARIVTVSSEGHYRVEGIDYDAVRSPTRTRTAFHEYCVSKLANVLHSQELSRRLDGSGVTAPEVAGDSGLYYDDYRRKEPSRHATPERAAELWERSEAWVNGA
jgi:retinol dehydrogenase-12